MNIPACLIIALDHPPSLLRSNAPRAMSRGGRMAYHSAKKTYRDYARLKAIEAIGRRTPPNWARCNLEIVWYAERASWFPDRVNVPGCVKYGIDGVVKAGVMINDRGIEGVKISTEIGKPCVVLKFFPIEEQQQQ